MFLGGFRLGRFIERADKSFVPITPSIVLTQPATSPTTTPILLSTFTHECGVSFSYPSSLKINEEATNSAKLNDGSQTIEVLCHASSSATPSQPKDIEPTIIKIQNQNVRLFRTAKNDIWTVREPKKQRFVMFETSTNLTDLITKTLRFE